MSVLKDWVNLDKEKICVWVRFIFYLFIFFRNLTRGPKATTLRTDSMKKKVVNTMLRYLRTLSYVSDAPWNCKWTKKDKKGMRGVTLHSLRYWRRYLVHAMFCLHSNQICLEVKSKYKYFLSRTKVMIIHTYDLRHTTTCDGKLPFWYSIIYTLLY